MSKEIYYRHCRLEKKNADSSQSCHTYLPDSFAKVGKVVKLKDDNGTWDNGWVVKEASENRLADSNVPDYHNLIKRHRQATGDALPKNA